MNFIISSAGNPSVGIPGCTATVTIDDIENWDIDHETFNAIENAKQRIYDAFTDIFDDGDVQVMTESEILFEQKRLMGGNDHDLEHNRT